MFPMKQANRMTTSDAVENNRRPDRSMRRLNKMRKRLRPILSSYLTRMMFEKAFPEIMNASPTPTRSGEYPRIERYTGVITLTNPKTKTRAALAMNIRARLFIELHPGGCMLE
jgi:hypothetical protein